MIKFSFQLFVTCLSEGLPPTIVFRPCFLYFPIIAHNLILSFRLSNPHKLALLQEVLINTNRFKTLTDTLNACVGGYSATAILNFLKKN